MVIQAPRRTARTKRTTAMQPNGTEVLSKLIASRCRKLCPTNLALYYLTFSDWFSFFCRMICLEIGVLGVFIIPNSEVSVASNQASSEDMAVFHISNFTDSIDFNIDISPASIIITRSTPSLYSFPSLLNCPISSFSASIQLALSFLLLEPSGSCHAGLRLFTRIYSLVFCAALAAVAEDYFGEAVIGSCSCSNSDLQLFSLSGLDSESFCSFYLSFS